MPSMNSPKQHIADDNAPICPPSNIATNTEFTFRRRYAAFLGTAEWLFGGTTLHHTINTGPGANTEQNERDNNVQQVDDEEHIFAK